MTYSILQLCGIEATHDIAASLLNALFQVCNSRRPLGQQAIVVTPEAARLVQRAAQVEEWALMGLTGLSKKLARYTTRGGELLLISIGEAEPRFRTISIGPVRYAFGAAAQVKGAN